ncbi:NAD-binding protein [Tumidithrix elongata RA019]|uniref:NAD-binding protein n=1 Tax=Tumidithrix elongata BACA0141 TaxID=2716417 RepID=A0AAW9PUL7_9CYAN|nr:NAD-binding protein [Tumidithrix elongata RA019]
MLESTEPENKVEPNRVLVCGLGSLGQNCVKALKEFGSVVSAIEQVQPTGWEISELPSLLENLFMGDCRQTRVLEQAGVRQCRAILLVTSNEKVNIETAFAARLLNPEIRLVVRSAKQNLNDLLGQHLGNFVAFEPTQLPATAFALAALSEEILGFFTLDGQLMRVVQQKNLHELRLVHEFNNRHRRILEYLPCDRLPEPRTENFENPFYQWEPEARVKAEDRLTYIEIADVANASVEKNKQKDLTQFLSEVVRGLLWQNLREKFAKYWQWTAENQTRLVATLCAIVVVVLVVLGTTLFLLFYPDITFTQSFFTASSLLLSGYGDMFGGVTNNDPAPTWLRFFALSLTVIGTALLGLLYGLLTESMLSARFQFLSRRPPIPEQGHVVLIGLGRVGQRVAALLQEFNQPFVAIANSEIAPSILPKMPLIVGDINHALTKANLAQAKSLVVVTDDEMINLEVAMMTHVANPDSYLVIRTFDQSFTDNLSKLLPYADVLCANAISAEAFAAAAYGENVISLFRLNNQTILVTEYLIQAGDTLNGLILAEVAYGYGVVPILHQEPQKTSKFMPSDDTRLNVGDRLVVLATIKGLQAVELGAIAAPTWSIYIEKALTKDAIFEGANVIVRVTDAPMSEARELMENLPKPLMFPLHKLQAQRLVRELAKAQVVSYIIDRDISADSPDL